MYYSGVNTHHIIYKYTTADGIIIYVENLDGIDVTEVLMAESTLIKLLDTCQNLPELPQTSQYYSRAVFYLRI